MAVGGFLSSAALPPFNAWLISTWGWPMAWRVWSGYLYGFVDDGCSFWNYPWNCWGI